MTGVTPDGRTRLQQRLAAAPAWAPVRERDVVYLPAGDGTVLVVASDVHGGVGPKPQDPVAFPGYDLGRFAARVPLVELLATGARPVLLTDLLAVEMDPTGREILRGVLDEAALADLPADAVTGSTEDTLPTVATAVGVTAVGIATPDRLRAGAARAGAQVLLVGRPRSGADGGVSLDASDVLDVPTVRRLLEIDGVLDVLPVGSSGIASELQALATSAGLLADAPDHAWPVAPDTPGGPATTCLVALDPALPGDDGDRRAQVAAAVDRPAWTLGHLVGAS